MLQVTVALPSGRAECFSVDQGSTVGDLKVLAQQTLQQGFLRLVTTEGRVLDDFQQSLLTAGLQDGDHVTAFVLQPRVVGTSRADLWKDDRGGAFALWFPGGESIITWGHPNCGGDSSAVQSQLKGVQQLQATSCAFAAILADGSVVSWGHPVRGGDSSAVQSQLKGVQEIQATEVAFAAILADGSVVSWGSPVFGGDSSAVQSQLKG
ncbi:Spon1, partial [Symbiodinium necroappetens]